MVHVPSGPDPKTGLPRVARGRITVNNFPMGHVPMEGIALGGLTLAGIGGVFVVSGISFRIKASDGLSMGAYFALGGLVISSPFAVDTLEIGPYTVGIVRGNPQVFKQLERSWLNIRKFRKLF